LGEEEEMVPASATSVTPDLFNMLGVSPILGRHFADDDIDESRVIVSHGLWRTRLGGDPEIVGGTITLSGRQAEVIGVMPPGFGLHTGRGSQLSTHVDLWLPLEIREFRNFWGFPTLVRLAESISFEQVNERLVPFAQGLTEAHPEHYSGTSLRYVVHPLLPDLVRESRPVIQAALAGVLLLLVIAISNATALVVARLKSRETDLAIRSAIGAGRRTLVLDALLESVLLSTCGAALGGAIASGGIAGLRTFIPRTVPRWDTITLGWDLLGYSAALALLGLLLAGIVPAWKASQGAPWDTLRGASRQGGSSRAPTRFMLVGTQIAMAVVLTFGAIQLARSAMRLASADLGFDAHVLALRVPFDGRTFRGPLVQAELYQRVRDRLSELLGVRSVGAISHLPLSGTGPVDAYTPNLADSASMDQAMANYFAVLPGYLETMRVSLRQGRYFNDT
jgi:putative ABC transport system permease protein